MVKNGILLFNSNLSLSLSFRSSGWDNKQFINPKTTAKYLLLSECDLRSSINIEYLLE
jgi:hypothetical protein